MIDQPTIDKITDAAQIYDVVSEFVSLKRSGRGYVGLCPFHNDRSPSFTVSPSRNICKCFSCGAGGNPVSFLMKKESMTYVEALRWLAKKYNIEIEEKELSPEQRERQTAHEGMFMVNEFAQKTFEEDLYNTPEGRNVGLTYLRERGLQDEIIKAYHLGYALEKKDDLARRAIAAGMKRDYLLDDTGVGLCYGQNPGKLPTCRFAGRIIFPHHTISGKPVAFGGRILQRVDHAYKKYVNSPESAIYHKSDLPYGLYEAKGAMVKADNCYVVEGNFDVISMAQAGFRNVVAASGTSLTSEHIRIIKRFTSNVTLMFDGDDAGIKAALKSIDLLLAEGMNVKVLLFPDGDDPDSFTRKHTTQEIQDFFDKNAVDFVTFKCRLLYRPEMLTKDPLRYNQVLNEIVKSVALIQDPMKASVYVRQLSQIMFANEAMVMTAMQGVKRQLLLAEIREREMAEKRVQMERERQELKRLSEAMDKENVGDTTGDIVADSGSTAGTSATSPAPDTQATTPVTELIPVNNGDDITSAPIRMVGDSTINPIIGNTNREQLVNAVRCAESNIIRNIVRYCCDLIAFEWMDENNTPQRQEWRVIDFIGYELDADQITFSVPIYAHMFDLALEQTSNPEIPFDSNRYFNNLISEPKVMEVAHSMSYDGYEVMGTATNNEKLDQIVPRSILELKVAICHLQISDLELQLNDPNVDFRTILAEIQKKHKIRQALEKSLGERVVVKY